MFRIGEFAVLTSISIHMLRNYDKIGLLSPDHTDPWTGYRYYSENQLITANRIQALKGMGLGLKEISGMLRVDSFGESYKELLKQKIEEKKNDIKKIKEEISQLELSLEKVDHEENYVCDVAVKSLPARDVISYRSQIHTFSEESRLWEHLVALCQKHEVKLVTNGFAAAIMHEINHEKHYSDVEVVFEVEKISAAWKAEITGGMMDDITLYQMPACEVASIAFRGQYYEIGNINYHLGQWITHNHYEVCGDRFSVYYVSPGNSNNVDDYLTEICIPIKKKK